MAVSSDDLAVLDQLAEEFVGRLRRGERPPLKPYVERHPDLASEIERLFPTLVTMEKIGSSTDAVVYTRRSTIPDRIGEYRILRQIGEGGMGIVYEAVQESLGRHVALKVLPAHARSSSRFRERFRRESRAAARLQHPHIVPVFGGGESDGTHYYAMQYISGTGLDVLLQPAGTSQDQGEETVTVHGNERTDDTARQNTAALVRTSPPEAGIVYFRRMAVFVRQAAEALAYAHQEGIIHRDIKPSNLLLDDHGSIWVTDFGLAKTSEADGLTEPGDIVGTIRYMAPERFNGWSDVRSDVYGLGATLFELLTRRPMYDDADRAKLIQAILHVEAPRLRKLNRAIPRELETIVLKATAREPSQRYLSAEALAEDLRRYEAGRPILANRQTLTSHALSWCRRKPFVAGMAGTVAMLLLVLLAGSLIVNVRLDDQNSQIVNQNQQIGDTQAALKNQLSETISARSREAEANVEARRQLKLALRRQAQAARWSRQPGSRGEALEAVRQLTELAREFPLSPEETFELRNLVIAASAQLDVIPESTDHPSAPPHALFSPDLQHYLLSNDKGLVVYEYSSGKEVARMQQAGVHSFQFTPDSKYLVLDTSSRVKNQTKFGFLIWDWPANKVVAEIPAERGFAHCGVKHDGTELALAYAEGTLAIHAIPDGRKLRTMPVSSGIQGVQYSPRGDQLAFRRRVYQLEIWDLADGKLNRTISTPSGAAIMGIRWSADGRMIAATCANYRAHVWHTESGHLAADLLGHQAEVTGCIFDPKGQWVATTSWDRSTRFWNPVTGLHLLTIPGEVVAVSSDGSRLGFRTNTHSGICTLTKAEEFKSLHGHLGAKGPWHASFGLDGRILATSSPDAIRFWDPESGRSLGELRPPGGALTAIFSPDGRYLLTSGHQHCSRWPTRYDSTTNTLHVGPAEALLEDQAGSSERRATLSADGGRAAINNKLRGNVYVFRLEDPALWRSVGPLKDLVNVALSPDGRWVIGTTWPSGKTRVWDTLTHQTAFDFPMHEKSIAVAFSPDGREVVLGSDHIAEIWSVGQWKHLRKVPSEPSFQGFLNPTFSTDGSVLIGSRGANWELHMLDAKSLKPIARLVPPDPQINGVMNFSNDGSWLAVTCGTNVIQLWNLRAIRDRLRTFGLDWDLPAYTADRHESSELRVVVVGEQK